MMIRRLLDLPELNVFVFGFLLNLPWEFLQTPFYEGIASAPHWESTRLCTQAAVGDAAMTLVAFWVVSAAAATREWVLRPTRRQVAAFVLTGLSLTAVFEWLATGVLERWTYTDAMPTLPLLGTGLLPLLQWTLLPPLILWFVGRQLRPWTPG